MKDMHINRKVQCMLMWTESEVAALLYKFIIKIILYKLTDKSFKFFTLNSFVNKFTKTRMWKIYSIFIRLISPNGKSLNTN